MSVPVAMQFGYRRWFPKNPQEAGILGPAASASPRNLTQILSHISGPTESGTLSHCVKPCLKLAITLDSGRISQ